MRLIDADALTEKYGDWYTEEGTEEGYIGTIRGIVESAPTIYDAPAAQPEIIRCKECKHSEHWYRDKRRCFLWVEDGIDVFDDGFCNYAERRTDVKADKGASC